MEKRRSLLWTFIRGTIINFLVLLAFSGLFKSSLTITKPLYGFYAAIILTILYMFIKPLLVMISIVPIVMTFGIFMVVINAALISMVSYIMTPEFEVSSFGAAFFLAIFISVLNGLLNGNSNIIIKRF